MKTKNSLYFETLINSFKLVIHNKALWFFSLFAMLLGTGQWFNYLSSDFLNVMKGDGLFVNLYKTNVFNTEFLVNFSNKAITEPFSFVTVSAIFLLIAFLTILLIWILVSAQGGLIYSISEASKNKKIDIRGGLYVGRSKFWQVFSLNFIVKFFIWSLSILIGVFNYLLIIEKYSSASILISIASVFIFLFLLLLYFVFKYSLAFIVLRGQDAIGAIKSGFKLFLNNWVLSLEVGIFLFVIDYLFVYILVYGFKLLLVPINLVGELSLTFDSSVSFGFYIIFVPVLFSVLVLFTISVLTAYNFTVWTTIFMKITENNNIPSVIGSTINKTFKRFKKYEQENR